MPRDKKTTLEILENKSKFQYYSEDEIKSALHSSFQDYLDSKNITLEEYEELMDKVIKAYAKEDKSEEEVASLLSKLNDAGTRDGGSR